MLLTYLLTYFKTALRNRGIPRRDSLSSVSYLEVYRNQGDATTNSATYGLIFEIIYYYLLFHYLSFI